MKNLIFICLIVVFTAGAVEAQYASLAIDQKAGDQYGWTINYETQAEADEWAMKECEEGGSDNCYIVLRFEGGCGAYVVERGNNSLYGWGTADTRSAAVNRAKSEARAIGGTNLVVRVWGCNGGNLIDSKITKRFKGVFFYYFLYAADENRCFVTDALYQPSVARKQGGRWVWTDDAEEIMKRRADKWMDVIEDNLYGYLGDLKDEAYTRGKLDWKGKNEVDHNNQAFSWTLKKRQEFMGYAVNQAIKLCNAEGAEVVKVDA